MTKSNWLQCIGVIVAGHSDLELAFEEMNPYFSEAGMPLKRPALGDCGLENQWSIAERRNHVAETYGDDEFRIPHLRGFEAISI